MQGRIYNVAVADDGLDHIDKTTTIRALRIDIEQGMRPVARKRQYDYQRRRQRYKRHSRARGQKARTLHRLGIDKPNKAAKSENETALEIQLAAMPSVPPTPSESVQIISNNMYAAEV